MRTPHRQRTRGCPAHADADAGGDAPAGGKRNAPATTVFQSWPRPFRVLMGLSILPPYDEDDRAGIGRGHEARTRAVKQPRE